MHGAGRDESSLLVRSTTKFSDTICFIFIFYMVYYATYKRRKAIIKANNPVASEKANPKIAYENNCDLKEGFLATPKIRAPNTTPIPTPAPINPVVAKPVPIILAACNIYILGMCP